MTSEEIFIELKEAQEGLKSLENQYVGNTPAQQRTLNLLKQANLSYRQEKEVLTLKIQYLRALLDKQQTDDFLKKERYEESYYDAMLDSI